jgi:ABC-type phosphate transport system substrate-binding protein
LIMKRYRSISILFVSILLGSSLMAQSALPELTVIGNKTGIESTSLKEIKQIFKGKYSSWPIAKSTVTIVLPSPKSPNAQKVATQIYGNTVSGVQKYWLSLVFQGRANPPIFLDSDEEIIEIVRKNSGSIGIISSSYPSIPKSLVINIVN